MLLLEAAQRRALINFFARPRKNHERLTPDSILDQWQSTTLSNAANASCVPEGELFIRG